MAGKSGKKAAKSVAARSDSKAAHSDSKAARSDSKAARNDSKAAALKADAKQPSPAAASESSQPAKFELPKAARRENMAKFGQVRLDPTRPFHDPRTFSSRLHREGFTPYGWILPCTLFTPGEAPLKYYELFE